MRKAWIAGVATAGFGVLVACVGGPGPLPDQGPDPSGQGQGNAQQTPSNGTSGNAGTGTTSPPPTPKPIAAGEVSQSCKDDTECVSVYQGDVCAACQCPNAAIASKAASDYQSKLADRAKDCPATGGDVPCAACPPSTFACVAGKCTFSTSRPDAG